MDEEVRGGARATAPGAAAKAVGADLGRRGEDLAVAHLEAQGLVVLSRNWRCREGELDVVATDGTRVVFCEVKTRSGERFGSPALAVDPVKARRVRRAAAAWFAAHHVGWCEARFDVICVVLPPTGPAVLEHLVGVF